MGFLFPGSPTEDQEHTPSGGPTYVFQGGAWRAQSIAAAEEVVGGLITIASTAPSSPATNDIWIDTT